MKLWKENRIDQEYELSHQEIADKYLASKKEEIGYYPLRQSLLLFIGDKDGLNSVVDESPEKDLRIIEKLILAKI